jgi:hypothetical protein
MSTADIPPPAQDDAVTVNQEGFDEGQDAYEIRTPAARYLYHKVGGGFSSLIDRDGNDWLGYRPGDGPAGEYRGIPNMVFRRGGGHNNHFHPGHAGHMAAVSRLVDAGPLKVTIESSVGEDRWRVRWEIYPDFARLTVLDIDPGDPGYWFLYEGTPGGRFNKRDRCLRSDGTDSALSSEWEARAIDWVAFRVPRQRRSLLLQLESDIDVPVSYYPMKPMTVFGFGRRLGSAENLLSITPIQITVRLLETADPQEIDAIASARA